MLPSGGKQPQEGNDGQGSDQSVDNGAPQGHTKGFSEIIKDGGERPAQVEAPRRNTAAGAARSLLRLLGAAGSSSTSAAPRSLATPLTQDGSQVSFAQGAESCMGGGIHGGYNTVTFNKHQHTYYQNTAQDSGPPSQAQGREWVDRGRAHTGGDSQFGPECGLPLGPVAPCQAFWTSPSQGPALQDSPLPGVAWNKSQQPYPYTKLGNGGSRTPLGPPRVPLFLGPSLQDLLERGPFVWNTEGSPGTGEGWSHAHIPPHPQYHSQKIKSYTMQSSREVKGERARALQSLRHCSSICDLGPNVPPGSYHDARTKVPIETAPLHQYPPGGGGEGVLARLGPGPVDPPQHITPLGQMVKTSCNAGTVPALLSAGACRHSPGSPDRAPLSGASDCAQKLQTRDVGALGVTELGNPLLFRCAGLDVPLPTEGAAGSLATLGVPGLGVAPSPSCFARPSPGIRRADDLVLPGGSVFGPLGPLRRRAIASLSQAQSAATAQLGWGGPSRVWSSLPSLSPEGSPSRPPPPPPPALPGAPAPPHPDDGDSDAPAMPDSQPLPLPSSPPLLAGVAGGDFPAAEDSTALGPVLLPSPTGPGSSLATATSATTEGILERGSQELKVDAPQPGAPQGAPSNSTNPDPTLCVSATVSSQLDDSAGPNGLDTSDLGDTTSPPAIQPTNTAGTQGASPTAAGPPAGNSAMYVTPPPDARRFPPGKMEVPDDDQEFDQDDLDWEEVRSGGGRISHGISSRTRSRKSTPGAKAKVPTPDTPDSDEVSEIKIDKKTKTTARSHKKRAPGDAVGRCSKVSRPSKGLETKGEGGPPSSSTTGEGAPRSPLLCPASPTPEHGGVRKDWRSRVPPPAGELGGEALTQGFTVHDTSEFGRFPEVNSRLLRSIGHDPETTFHDCFGSEGGAQVCFLMASDDVKEEIERVYAPLPDVAQMKAVHTKGNDASTTLEITCNKLLAIAKEAYLKENGRQAPEGKWCVQLFRRFRSDPRKIGPRSKGGEWRLLMKLERDARELGRRLGHLPIDFPDYDTWGDGLPQEDWENLDCVPYSLSARQFLTYFAKRLHGETGVTGDGDVEGKEGMVHGGGSIIFARVCLDFGEGVYGIHELWESECRPELVAPREEDDGGQDGANKAVAGDHCHGDDDLRDGGDGDDPLGEISSEPDEDTSLSGLLMVGEDDKLDAAGLAQVAVDSVELDIPEDEGVEASAGITYCGAPSVHTAVWMCGDADWRPYDIDPPLGSVGKLSVWGKTPVADDEDRVVSQLAGLIGGIRTGLDLGGGGCLLYCSEHTYRSRILAWTGVLAEICRVFGNQWLALDLTQPKGEDTTVDIGSMVFVFSRHGARNLLNSVFGSSGGGLRIGKWYSEHEFLLGVAGGGYGPLSVSWVVGLGCAGLLPIWEDLDLGNDGILKVGIIGGVPAGEDVTMPQVARIMCMEAICAPGGVGGFLDCLLEKIGMSVYHSGGRTLGNMGNLIRMGDSELYFEKALQLIDDAKALTFDEEEASFLYQEPREHSLLRLLVNTAGGHPRRDVEAGILNKFGSCIDSRYASTHLGVGREGYGMLSVGVELPLKSLFTNEIFIRKNRLPVLYSLNPSSLGDGLTLRDARLAALVFGVSIVFIPRKALMGDEGVQGVRLLGFFVEEGRVVRERFLTPFELLVLWRLSKRAPILLIRHELGHCDLISTRKEERRIARHLPAVMAGIIDTWEVGQRGGCPGTDLDGDFPLSPPGDAEGGGQPVGDATVVLSPQPPPLRVYSFTDFQGTSLLVRPEGLDVFGLLGATGRESGLPGSALSLRVNGVSVEGGTLICDVWREQISTVEVFLRLGAFDFPLTSTHTTPLAIPGGPPPGGLEAGALGLATGSERRLVPLASPVQSTVSIPEGQAAPHRTRPLRVSPVNYTHMEVEEGKGFVWSFARAYAREDGSLAFYGLEVRDAGGGKGLGVFACEDLPVGFTIPIVGRFVPEGTGSSHLWYFPKGVNMGSLVSGDPRRGDKVEITFRGLGVALLINWPGEGEKANCLFIQNCATTTEQVRTGNELLLRYWHCGSQDKNCVEGMTLSEDAFENTENWVGAGVELSESAVSREVEKLFDIAGISLPGGSSCPASLHGLTPSPVCLGPVPTGQPITPLENSCPGNTPTVNSPSTPKDDTSTLPGVSTTPTSTSLTDGPRAHPPSPPGTVTTLYDTGPHSSINNSTIDVGTTTSSNKAAADNDIADNTYAAPREASSEAPTVGDSDRTDDEPPSDPPAYPSIEHELDDVRLSISSCDKINGQGFSSTPTSTLTDRDSSPSGMGSRGGDIQEPGLRVPSVPGKTQDSNGTENSEGVFAAQVPAPQQPSFPPLGSGQSPDTGPLELPSGATAGSTVLLRASLPDFPSRSDKVGVLQFSEEDGIASLPGTPTLQSSRAFADFVTTGGMEADPPGKGPPGSVMDKDLCEDGSYSKDGAGQPLQPLEGVPSVGTPTQFRSRKEGGGPTGPGMGPASTTLLAGDPPNPSPSTITGAGDTGASSVAPPSMGPVVAPGAFVGLAPPDGATFNSKKRKFQAPGLGSGTVDLPSAPQEAALRETVLAQQPYKDVPPEGLQAAPMGNPLVTGPSSRGPSTLGSAPTAATIPLSNSRMDAGMLPLRRAAPVQRVPEGWAVELDGPTIMLSFQERYFCVYPSPSAGFPGIYSSVCEATGLAMGTFKLRHRTSILDPLLILPIGHLDEESLHIVFEGLGGCPPPGSPQGSVQGFLVTSDYRNQCIELSDGLTGAELEDQVSGLTGAPLGSFYLLCDGKFVFPDVRLFELGNRDGFVLRLFILGRGGKGGRGKKRRNDERKRRQQEDSKKNNTSAVTEVKMEGDKDWDDLGAVTLTGHHLQPDLGALPDPLSLKGLFAATGMVDFGLGMQGGCGFYGAMASLNALDHMGEPGSGIGGAREEAGGPRTSTRKRSTRDAEGEIILRTKVARVMEEEGASQDTVCRILASAVYGFGSITLDLIPPGMDILAVIGRIEAEMGKVRSHSLVALDGERLDGPRVATVAFAEEPVGGLSGILVVNGIQLPWVLTEDPVSQGGHIEVAELPSLCAVIGSSCVVFREEALLLRNDSPTELTQCFVLSAGGGKVEVLLSPAEIFSLWNTQDRLPIMFLIHSGGPSGVGHFNVCLPSSPELRGDCRRAKELGLHTRVRTDRPDGTVSDFLPGELCLVSGTKASASALDLMARSDDEVPGELASLVNTVRMLRWHLERLPPGWSDPEKWPIARWSTGVPDYPVGSSLFLEGASIWGRFLGSHPDYAVDRSAGFEWPKDSDSLRGWLHWAESGYDKSAEVKMATSVGHEQELRDSAGTRELEGVSQVTGIGEPGIDDNTLDDALREPLRWIFDALRHWDASARSGNEGSQLSQLHMNELWRDLQSQDFGEMLLKILACHKVTFPGIVLPPTDHNETVRWLGDNLDQLHTLISGEGKEEYTDCAGGSDGTGRSSPPLREDSCTSSNGRSNSGSSSDEDMEEYSDATPSLVGYDLIPDDSGMRDGDDEEGDCEGDGEGDDDELESVQMVGSGGHPGVEGDAPPLPLAIMQSSSANFDFGWTYAQIQNRDGGPDFCLDGVEVREVSGTKGAGVFATKPLPGGFIIVVTGDIVPPGTPVSSFVWKVQAGPQAGSLVSGDPRTTGVFKIPCRGLGVALLINHPGEGEKANCVYSHDCVHTIGLVAPGEELLLRYKELVPAGGVLPAGMTRDQAAFKDVEAWEATGRQVEIVKIHEELRRFAGHLVGNPDTSNFLPGTTVIPGARLQQQFQQQQAAHTGERNNLPPPSSLNLPAGSAWSVPLNSSLPAPSSTPAPSPPSTGGQRSGSEGYLLGVVYDTSGERFRGNPWVIIKSGTEYYTYLPPRDQNRMYQRRAYVWFKVGRYSIFNNIWAKNYPSAVDVAEVTVSTQLDLLIKGKVVEVHANRIVLEQDEDPIHFKLGTTITDTQKKQILRTNLFWDQYIHPRPHLSPGDMVVWGSCSVAEDWNITRPMVTRVELNREVTLQGVKSATGPGFLERMVNFDPNFEIGGAPGGSGLPFMHVSDAGSLIFPWDGTEQFPIEQALGISASYYKVAYNGLTEVEKRDRDNPIVEGNRYHRLREDEPTLETNIVIHVKSMKHSATDWALAAERSASLRKGMGLTAFKVIIIVPVDDLSTPLNWRTLNSLLPLQDWSYRFLNRVTFFPRKVQFRAASGVDSKGAVVWSESSVGRLMVAAMVFTTDRASTVYDVDVGVEEDTETGYLSEVSTPFRSSHAVQVAFPLRKLGGVAPTAFWSHSKCPEVSNRSARRHLVEEVGMRVLVTSSALGAEATLRVLKNQLHRGLTLGSRTRFCAMMSDDLLGRGEGLVTVRCRRGGFDLSLLTMVLGTAEVFPIGNDEFRLKLTATQTVESVADSLRKANHDLKRAGKPSAFRALFGRLGDKVIWEERTVPLVGLKARDYGWPNGGELGGGGFIFLSGVEPGLTTVLLRKVLRHFLPGMAKDVLWMASQDNEVFLRVKVGDVVSACRQEFSDDKLDIKVTACREEDLPKGIEWMDRWSPFEDEESPPTGEVDNDDLDPEIDSLLRLLTNHYGFGQGASSVPAAQGEPGGSGEARGSGVDVVAEGTGTSPGGVPVAIGGEGNLVPRESLLKGTGKGKGQQAPAGKGSRAGRGAASGGRKGGVGLVDSGRGKAGGFRKLAVANVFEALQESGEDSDVVADSGGEGSNSDGNNAKSGRKRRKQSREGGQGIPKAPAVVGNNPAPSIADEHGGSHVEIIGSDETEEGRTQLMGRLLSQAPSSGRTFYQLHLNLCAFLEQTPLGDNTDAATVKAAVKAQKRTLSRKQKALQKAAGPARNAGAAKEAVGKGIASGGRPGKPLSAGLDDRKQQAQLKDGTGGDKELGILAVVEAAPLSPSVSAVLEVPGSRNTSRKKPAQTRMVQSQIRVIKTPTQGSQNKRDHSSISPSKGRGPGRSRQSGGDDHDGSAAKKGKIMVDLSGPTHEASRMDTSTEGTGALEGERVIRAIAFGEEGHQEGGSVSQGGGLISSGDLSKAGEDSGVGVGL